MTSRFIIRILWSTLFIVWDTFSIHHFGNSPFPPSGVGRRWDLDQLGPLERASLNHLPNWVGSAFLRYIWRQRKIHFPKLCMLNVPQTVDSVQNSIRVVPPLRHVSLRHARAHLNTPPPISCHERVTTRSLRETFRFCMSERIQRTPGSSCSTAKRADSERTTDVSKLNGIGNKNFL